MIGLRVDTTDEPDRRLGRIWSAACDRPTPFNSLASYTSGIGCVRVGGVTTVHLRGPATQATPLTCSAGSEFFGADFRTGCYLTVVRPARLINMSDTVLPALPDGRVLLGGQAWEVPTADNIDVFVDRLERAGLLIFDPLVEELRYGGRAPIPDRTAQHRFLRAVGLSRRTFRLIERTRTAARRLRSGVPIGEVVAGTGFYDQPQLTRALRRLIGHTPVEVARGGMFLDL
ncbi:helix-turn-helix domain-containing protein [Microlunatus parietis]|uniref:AraC-like DNA-binding protein n=1 Tax=Microlunatus parietis TaxID=682979 RepID=A0A7Y9L9Y9_9ACTN|nr:helix-turn-helix domain-containing protein [Microlunatus parietis]NYE69090.1 AraC-like DNA-binding protein [Microlunatus parietis]